MTTTTTATSSTPVNAVSDDSRIHIQLPNSSQPGTRIVLGPGVSMETVWTSPLLMKNNPASGLSHAILNFFHPISSISGTGHGVAISKRHSNGEWTAVSRPSRKQPSRQHDSNGEWTAISDSSKQQFARELSAVVFIAQWPTNRSSPTKSIYDREATGNGRRRWSLRARELGANR